MAEHANHMYRTSEQPGHVTIKNKRVEKGAKLLRAEKAQILLSIGRSYETLLTACLGNRRLVRIL